MLFRSIYLLIIALGVPSWANQDSVTTDTVTKNKPAKIISEDELRRAEQKINQFNQSLACTADEDCVVIGVGFKACGGPFRYIVSSRKSANFQKLKKSIETYNRQDKSYSTSHNLGSTCDVPPKPYGSCQSKLCHPTIPTAVDPKIYSIPPGALISIETRIQSLEAFKKIWRKNSYPALQEPPFVDFSKFDLIPWNFCEKAPNGIFYFRLGRIGDVGQKLVVNYSKFNGCTEVDPITCEIQLAEVPKKETTVEVRDQKQNCGNSRK